jgi:hypothetical protein
LDDGEREEVGRIIEEIIRKALLSGGAISTSLDERLVYVGKDIHVIKDDINKLRADLDKHFEKHLKAWERKKQVSK